MRTTRCSAATPGEEMLDRLVRERIMKSLHHREGDRVPIWDLIDNKAVYDHFAPGESDPFDAGAKVYNGLGIDLCRGFTDPCGPEQNGTTWVDRDREMMITGQSRWIKSRPYRTVDDLRKIEIPPASEEQIREEEAPNFIKAQEKMAPRTMLVPGGGCGFHGTYGHIGLTLFSIAVYDARWEIERIMNRFVENAYLRAKVFAEKRLCPIYFIGDDVAYKGTTMFSPAFLRQTFIPALRRVVWPLKEAGIKVIFHSDGNVMGILDDMIEAGIDGLNPIEPLAGMDIGLLKRRYGGRLVLVGNVDCSQLLPLGTVEEIREGVKACLRAAAGGGGHFIGSSSEIVPATPLENVLAFYEAIREFGRYALGG